MSTHTPRITHAQPLPTHLRIAYEDAPNQQHTLDFHYIWLRHQCPASVHPKTRERIICSSEIDLNLKASSVNVGDDQASITIQWATPDAHQSTFSLAWLIAHAYALDQPSPQPPPTSVEPLLLHYHPEKASDIFDQTLSLLRAHGLVIVRGRGLDTEAIVEDFARAGLSIRGTHFGRIEDLRTDNTTNQNTDQLGYTDAPINLHTDQPFITNPPRYQLLHCIRPADQGGDNAIVNSLAAAAYLRALDADAWNLLTSTPVHFHRKQKQFESLHISPILELDPQTQTHFRTRYSYFTQAPINLPFSQMLSWYRAFNRFAHLVRDPQHQYQVRLNAGDFLAYDNWQMLHARTAFSGPRWLRGVYFDPASK
jgi:alpha-ketoglutarate-dependent taurine dioxygenase